MCRCVSRIFTLSYGFMNSLAHHRNSSACLIFRKGAYYLHFSHGLRCITVWVKTGGYCRKQHSCGIASIITNSNSRARLFHLLTCLLLDLFLIDILKCQKFYRFYWGLFTSKYIIILYYTNTYNMKQWRIQKL